MARRDTIEEPAWRAQVLRSDLTVRSEKHSTSFAGGFEVREWFESVALEPGESALYQVRPAGSSRFLTWARRGAAPATRYRSDPPLT